MGTCFSVNNRKSQNFIQNSPTTLPNTLNSKERQYLHLIYQDLASRSKDHKLNHHNFCMYFELTGLWGNKLFRYFATNGQLQLSENEFVYGMGKIVRAPFPQRIKILFNFIKNPEDVGIRYKQFLKMLYHYSKDQLKEIMTNDGVFVHESIIPSTTQLKQEKRKQSQIVQLKHEPSTHRSSIENSSSTHYFEAYQKILQDYQDPGTLIQFKTQKITYQVSYCNMSALTKEYTSHIFQRYNINENNQTMNEDQFKNYIEGNRKLFDTYYATFHQNLWGFQQRTPLFISFIEKQSQVIVIQGQDRINSYMMLAFNTLIISESKQKKQQVFRMINLSGIAVNQMAHGKTMVIKDEPQDNFTYFFQFPTVQLTKMWLEQLKSYSNNYLQNKYEILETIGTGRFSVVFKCYQKQTRKQFALKVLQLDKLSAKQIATIEHETEIMKIFKSPNFIKQYETITTKRTIYIVSEYVYGQDLYEYVKKKKRLPQSEAAFLLRQIIEATIHLHSLQIIHRDLKPQNIMVSYKRVQSNDDHSPNKIARPKPEKIKLIDFGFANYFSVLQEVKQQSPVGTLGYMAPEILLGEKPSYQNDVFSIGCILYFMLRGKYPFDSTNPEGTAILTVKGDYSLHDSIWEQISDEAKELVQMLLMTDPEERIMLKEASNHPWFREISNYNTKKY